MDGYLVRLVKDGKETTINPSDRAMQQTVRLMEEADWSVIEIRKLPEDMPLSDYFKEA